MTRLRNTCTLALLLAALGAMSAFADEPRQYDIELLIFRHLVENDAGEIWPPDQSAWYEKAGESSPAGDDTALNVTWLPESSYHLKAERNALAGSAGFRPLAYLAWRQPVLGRDQARPLQIPLSGRPVGGYVDGQVKVAVERYLHLYLDLQLHLPGGSGRNEGSDGSAAGPVAIRLTEQRRMRSNELHYFDNPRFGVIALITPYTPPPAPAAIMPAPAATTP
jgi:hypothetical protein